ncbi:hypothetical protein Y032_0025g1147 [Ancylostoma ceylanicum]|uniref:Uncharacterized protein n=1 Tax=Ancylostoma ceylanicum TaxID=53326 RepID=A0A016UVR3_9BILA|nr:hypothetical protein Y032_0025g1147 [Ancylostoma ceylanicum]
MWLLLVQFTSRCTARLLISLSIGGVCWRLPLCYFNLLRRFSLFICRWYLVGKRKLQNVAEPTAGTPKRQGGSGENKAPSAKAQPPAQAPAPPAPAPPAAAPAAPAPAAPPANDDGNYEEIRVGEIPPPPPPA